MGSLLVTNDFPPKIGGIQSYLHELWRRLPPEDVTVLTTRYAGDHRFDAAQSFRIERARSRVLLPTRSLAADIDALGREVGADVILLDPALPLGRLGRRLRAAPHVIVVHGAEVTLPAHVPGMRGPLREVLRASAGVVAAGWYPARQAVRAARAPLDGIVVPPGVDVERFVPVRHEAERVDARRRLALAPEGRLVAGVSRLVPRKGFDVLIDAVAMLPQDVHLVIAGDGRDRARLEARARRLGLGARARFLGRVSDPELDDVYRAADVFSMLCRDRWRGLEAEGFGIVFLEAAATGLPCVAGRSGGSHEAVEHEVTGYVVDPGDVAEVHHRLEQLLTDDDLRRAFGAAARARAEAASYERRVDVLAPLTAGDLSVLRPLVAPEAPVA